jgi:type II secretory pathway pseudopilin PulG
VLAVLAILGISYANALTTYLRQQRDIAELESEVAAQTASIDQLEDEIARWQDPDYVRAQARQRLGWVLPGEVGYRVIAADGSLVGSETEVIDEAVSAENQGPWYERIWASIKAADQPEAEPTEAPGEAPTQVPPGETEPPE